MTKNGTRNVKIITRNVGHFGTVGILKDARTGRKLAETPDMNTTQTKTARRNYARDYVIHFSVRTGAACSNPRKRDRLSSIYLHDVTCKRCLAALAKTGK